MSTWLASANQKFKEKAVYYKQIVTDDGEQTRPALEGITFRCCEYELHRLNRMILSEGIASKQATLAILTDDKIGGKFEPDDLVEYQGHKRKIIWRGKIKNYATPNSEAYAIGLI